MAKLEDVMNSVKANGRTPPERRLLLHFSKHATLFVERQVKHVFETKLESPYIHCACCGHDKLSDHDYLNAALQVEKAR